MRGMRTLAGRALLAAALAGGALPVATAAPVGGASLFEDENIVKAAVARISARGFDNAHVNVACFHRRLLLTGEVANDGERSAVQQTVTGIPNVQSLDNELVVGPVSGISARTTDSWITSDVKFRLLKGGFGRNDVRVVTENGTVYLMGQLTRRQGAAAANIASTTNRVERVVLVFQYTD
jgi:osmotically-inducible protein OsmY